MAAACRSSIASVRRLIHVFVLAQGDERRRLGDQLHRRYVHAQFACGGYEEAMAHFGMCSDASPIVLLRLFPSLVSPETLEPLIPSAPGTPHAHTKDISWCLAAPAAGSSKHQPKQAKM